MVRTSRMFSTAVVAVALLAAACGSSAKSTGAKSGDTAMHDTTTTADAMHETPTTADAMHETPTTAGVMQSHSSGAMSSSYVKATDQEGDGTKISLEEVVITGGSGWVAVQADNGGAMGELLGVSSLLPAGPTMGGSISLMKPLTASATVLLVVHLEDNNNATFDFPAADAPAMVAGKVVEIPVHVTVK